jgi:hypothetical protein
MRCHTLSLLRIAWALLTAGGAGGIVNRRLPMEATAVRRDAAEDEARRVAQHAAPAGR